MPLKKGRSKAVVKANVKEMMHSGMPQKQAVAAAMKKAGMDKKDKVAHGGEHESGGCDTCKMVRGVK